MELWRLYQCNTIDLQSQVAEFKTNPRNLRRLITRDTIMPNKNPTNVCHNYNGSIVDIIDIGLVLSCPICNRKRKYV